MKREQFSRSEESTTWCPATADFLESPWSSS